MKVSVLRRPASGQVPSGDWMTCRHMSGIASFPLTKLPEKKPERRVAIGDIPRAFTRDCELCILVPPSLIE